MNRQLQFRRMVVLGLFMSLAFVGLGARLTYLQVLKHDALEATARGNYERTTIREPRRGAIRDVNGSALATSVFVKTVCADPSLIGNYQDEIAGKIAPLLDLDVAEVRAKLELREIRQTDDGKPVFDKYVVLKRNVRGETWEAVQAAMQTVAPNIEIDKLPKEADRQFYRGLRRSSIFADAQESQLRIYPNGSLAAHVLGYTGMTELDRQGKKVLLTTGKDGVEMTFNDHLSGVRGWITTQRDGKGRERVEFRDEDVPARAGYDVCLSLDASIQYIVETELSEAFKYHGAVSAVAIVTRPRTGEILGLASYPNYDPAHPGDTPIDHWRNRAITDEYEPGSTFKIVVISAALNEGLASLTDTFDCEHGSWFYAGKNLRDHGNYDLLTVEQIITKSSNIGAAKVGLLLGNERMYQYMRDFGFGSDTLIPLSGEVTGTVHPTRYWTKLSISRIPMGHEVAVTPIQLAMAMSALANNGLLMRPKLVDRLQDENGKVVVTYNPMPVRQVIRPEAARKMVQALKTVTRPGGTATRAAIEGYEVAGKTGTAQKAGKTGTAQKAGNGGYIRGAYFASFSGFFPADDPELCITVVFNEPQNHGYYGGTVAGPVFANIARRAANYLNIPPQLPEDSIVVTQVNDNATD